FIAVKRAACSAKENLQHFNPYLKMRLRNGRAKISQHLACRTTEAIEGALEYAFGESAPAGMNRSHLRSALVAQQNRQTISGHHNTCLTRLKRIASISRTYAFVVAGSDHFYTVNLFQPLRLPG